MEGITLSTDTIVTAAAVLSAIVAIFSIIFAAYRWYLRQNKQDEDIKALKEDMAIITVCQLACLKGLHEKGCNGPVTEAIHKMEAHLNERAYK